VLANLLENAVRHNPPGGQIRVRAYRAGNRVCLSVADSGPGVEPGEAQLIFEPFRSGSVAGTTGVGLAICKAIVEAHGGTIAVDEVPGGGAEFTISLPARCSPRAAG
jgi:two-component system sensor histidine kinase KdpD